MYANLKFVQDRFGRFNEEIFSNALPVIKLRIGSSRRALGSLSFKRRSVLGIIRYSDFTLTISNRLDLPEDVIEDTIIHEMIHLYIHYNHIKDTSAHGREFCFMMNEINRRHRRNISVSHRSSTEESSSDRLKRWHYILHSRTKGGEEYITLCARTRIFELNRMISRVAEIASWEWLVSSDTYFNSLPRSRSLKFYKITEETRRCLDGAVKCRCDGNRFYPV